MLFCEISWREMCFHEEAGRVKQRMRKQSLTDEERLLQQKETTLALASESLY